MSTPYADHVRRSSGQILQSVLRLTVGGAAVGGLLVAALAGWVRRVSAGLIVGVDEVPPAPVALVLGAEIYPGGRPSRFLQARLDLARELFRRGTVDVLLVSGDSGTPHYDETGGMHAYLVDHGVPPARIVCDPAGFDTYDSCVRARRVFGVTRAIVVSQTYHLPRALAVCRAVGIDAWGVGDQTARSNRQLWAYGTAREVAANLKLAWDLLSRRRPLLGPRDSAVADALRA